MERVFHKASSFKEAEEWEILQQIRLTPEQRQAIAAELKRRIFGENPPDVREAHRKG